jgi:hypothetical protein
VLSGCCCCQEFAVCAGLCESCESNEEVLQMAVQQHEQWFDVTQFIGSHFPQPDCVAAPCRRNCATSPHCPDVPVVLPVFHRITGCPD